MHMRSALPPNAYTRWRCQGINPQFAVDARTNNGVYRGDLRVDRWSEWRRTDAPCRSVNAPARRRTDQQSADRLPSSLRLLENHRKGLCPYCFYGGPAGINPNLQGRQQATQTIFTYSKSPGWLLTPTRGGAIQLAYLPGSWQGFISETMKAMSSSLGSQPPLFALH